MEHVHHLSNCHGELSLFTEAILFLLGGGLIVKLKSFLREE